MGLDSIELLTEIERYFGISIPDTEAEKIHTIQAMTDSVAHHLNITSDGMDLRDKIFQKTADSIQKLGWTDKKPELSDLISKYIPSDNKDVWIALTNTLNLSVPKPEIINEASTKISDKLKSLLKWTPNYDWSQLTVDQFITAVCANNYEELIEKSNIKNKYEVYVAVVGITVDKIGVDYYEITPDKSFTSDLGVD